MNSETNPSHVLDDIPVYLTGGLSAADREAFESHVAGCAQCESALAEAGAMDESLRRMFINAQPGADFEDHLIAGFRQRTTNSRTLHPIVRRVAIGVAATLLLGSAGAFYQRNMGRFEQTAGAGLAFSPTTQPLGSGFDMNGGTITAFPAEVLKALRGRVDLTGTSNLTFGNVTGGRGFHGSIDSSGSGAFPESYRTDTLKLEPATVASGIKGPATIPGTFDQNVSTKSLGGLNTYSGATFLNGGTLSVDANGASPKGSAHFARQQAEEFRATSSDAPSPVASPPSSTIVANSAPTAFTAPTAVSATSQIEKLKEFRGDFTGKTDLKMEPDALLMDGRKSQQRWASEDTGAKLAESAKRETADELSVAATTPPANSDADAKQKVALENEDPQQPVPPATPAAPQPAPADNSVDSRKIIREGELTFEVDSFDSTVMNIGKIVAEETGFVSTTDSDKLANGKVRGTVVVRVPPDHLDTLVLKLRGIGDLKSQKISAQDITKQYTDMESELRAARAMEERLLDIIKNGKGAVKDLLEAEKQLGVWREKIEQVEGEIRYDNNLISLSTLSITLMERDIKAAASTSINEQVTMSLETDKVETAYETARQAIDNAKGRITQSELKQFDAGQFGATIQAQLPPDQADAVIARIRQLDGRIANFQRERSQNSEGGSGAPVDASKVKHEDVTLALTIYNLANIAPRRTTTLTIVAADVDAAYSAMLDQASKAGARVVSSNLNHPRPDQSNGTISLTAASDKADALLAALRSNGELLGQESNDNPDSQNVTDAKRGVIVQVISLASVQARQSETLGIASTDVPAAFGGILDALRATDARILASQLNQQDPTNQTATIVFDISRAARPSLDAVFEKLGEVFSRNITRSQDTANTLDSKVHCELTLQSADVLPARQTTTLAVEVADVQTSVETLLTSAASLGGREIDKDISQDQNGRSIAHVIVEVPLTQADALSDQVESWGHRRSKQVTHDAQAPTGRLARGRLEVTLADAASGLGGEETTWDAIRHGLAVSGQGLRWSVQMLVIGGCIVVPWILVIWVGWKLLKRRKASQTTATTPAIL